MKAVVLAYHNLGCVGLDVLLRHGVEITAVFTHHDNPEENVWFDSVAEKASSLGIPVYAPENVNHPLWVERIRSLEPDVIFSIYYRSLISKELLALPRLGAFNLHGSLLPRYRGRCPVNWAILRGETETGVTLHEMVERADAGPIVGQRRIPIAQADDARHVFDRLVVAAEGLLDEVVPAIRNGTAPRIPQDESQATTFGGRRPEDGRISWNESARNIANLVRAVTSPYPGAFTWSGNRKLTIWSARVDDQAPLTCRRKPGEIVSDELQVACGDGRTLTILRGSLDSGVSCSGRQIARELGLVPGLRFRPEPGQATATKKNKRVMILGVNGFIGNALAERLLERGGYDVFGMDLSCDNLGSVAQRPGFEFCEGDISIHREWVEYHVRKCDVVLPLVAIATPIEYIRNPLGVFELDFEENLRVIRHCVRHGTRVVFPSTSEIYGMCEDDEFNEDTSRLVLGPIRMQRWIYSCSKQLLDRVIWAYGQQCGLDFTLFRPFNWIGPRLDSLGSARIGSSRVITQFILNLVEGSPMQLVDGGHQKRCFTDVADGVECLARVIDNPQGACSGEILNVGHPDNQASVRELGEMLVEAFDAHALRRHFPPFAGFCDVESETYYGEGYQDVVHRRPCIRNAKRLVDWTPQVPIREAVRRTLDFFLTEHFGDAAAPEIDIAVAPRERRAPPRIVKSLAS